MASQKRTNFFSRNRNLVSDPHGVVPSYIYPILRYKFDEILQDKYHNPFHLRKLGYALLLHKTSGLIWSQDLQY